MKALLQAGLAESQVSVRSILGISTALQVSDFMCLLRVIPEHSMLKNPDTGGLQEGRRTTTARMLVLR